MIDKRIYIIAISVYIVSIGFFVLGITHPIMGAEVFLGLKSTEIYLIDSFEYFYKREEYLLGTILLVFTIILPIAKYMFLVIMLLKVSLPNLRWVHHTLEIVNKWAMLDVFIVALLIMTFKFESTLIDNYVMIGTTYFAVSIILLMICSYLVLHINKRRGIRTESPAV